MQVIYGIGRVKKAFNNAVLAIGVFDGLHIGHQKLIKEAVRRAKAIGGPAIVMTFSPHPIQVLKPEKYLPFIISLPHRLKLIGSMGVMACIVVHFTKRFSQMPPSSFIRRYLAEGIKPKEIFVGDDFKFGKDRGGTLEYFQESGKRYGFKVNAIEPVKAGKSKIGSSRIRNLITDGKLAAARKLLGRDVSILGPVVPGDRRGRGLGYPTANIKPNNAVVPPVGVYAAYAVIGNKRYKAMANIGRRPSFSAPNSSINVEVHIFDFKKNLYGREIAVQFIRKIRNEKVFSSKENLANQLGRDEIKARSILKKS